MTNDSSNNLKTRYRNVFQILRREYEELPDNAAVPSLRAVKKRFGVGSAGAAEILHQLFELYGLEHSSRTKVRKKGTSGKGMNGFSSREPVLCMLSDMGYFWEPILQEFNRRHKQKIFVRYLTYLSDFREAIAHQSCDFYLFPTNPMFLEIVRDTGQFVDLNLMMSGLDPEEYYPSTFLRDAEGKLWGVAPNLVLDVLCVQRDQYHSPWVNLKWEKFRDILRQKRQTLGKGGGYPLEFPCYHSMMRHLGMQTVEPGTLRFDASPERYAYAYDYIRSLVDEKLAPYVSDGINPENKVSQLYRGRSLFHVFSYRRIPLAGVDGLELRPLPVRSPECRKVQSEIFAISASSMNYERAWNFIRFILSKEIQRQMLDSLQTMPVMRNLCPPNFSRMQFRLFAEALQKAERRSEDGYFTLSMQNFFDASLDRCLKYGGDLFQVQSETRRRYDAYWASNSNQKGNP